MADRVLISGIDAEAVLGVHEHERRARRPVVVDLELVCDLRAAEESDRLEDTVDYEGLTRRVRERCAGSGYRLVEALAGDIARLCLAESRVAAATVTITKPGAVGGVRSVAVAIERRR